MNVNPESNRFTDVVPWDSLSDEEQQSGEWIQLPDVEPRQARRKTLADHYGATKTAESNLLKAFGERDEAIRALEGHRR